MIQRLVLAASALLLLALPGCISTGGNNLSARVDRHDQQIQTLLSQVGQVEQVLPGQAEMWSQMQTMRQELNMLKGRIEEQSYSGGGGDGGGELARLRDKVSRLESVVRQMAAQLGVNVDALNVSDTGVSFPPPQQPGMQSSYTPQPEAAGGAAGAQAGAADAGTALYDSGIKAFDQRRYKEAVAVFKDFSAKHPRHKLAGNAHFWEGESYFQLKDYPRAALAYQEVIANFPGNSKLQASMLKQGMALYHAGKTAAAKEGLQSLINRYPSSQEAARAKQFLATNK